MIDCDPDAFAVVVTHMDLVTWDQRRFSDAINRKLGMDAVVYTQPNTTSSVLQQDILKVCLKSFMTEEITNSQKRVASENNFTFGCSEDGDLTFDGESAANEAGHIANLSNQLRAKKRSSNADESFTLKTEYFETPDGKLLIADISGSNAMDDTLGHNIQIATAFNILKDAYKTGLEISK